MTPNQKQDLYRKMGIDPAIVQAQQDKVNADNAAAVEVRRAALIKQMKEVGIIA